MLQAANLTMHKKSAFLRSGVIMWIRDFGNASHISTTHHTIRTTWVALQDVIRRFKDVNGDNWELFAEKVAFQLNDTHPTIAVPELMRQLMDDEGLGWTQSWQICGQARSLHACLCLNACADKITINMHAGLDGMEGVHHDRAQSAAHTALLFRLSLHYVDL